MREGEGEDEGHISSGASVLKEPVRERPDVTDDSLLFPIPVRPTK
jgi:hypothetical protein